MGQLGNKTRYQDAPTFDEVGDGTKAAFTLSWQPGFAAAVIVIVGGVPQPPSAYTVSGYVLTLSAPAPLGARVLAFSRGMRALLMQPGAGSVTSDRLDPSGIAIPAGSTGFPGVQGSFKNLQLSATGLSANVSVSADAVLLENAAFSTVIARGVALTLSGASVGANGLDTGALAISTWYSVWVIYNPTTQTVAGLLSLSATAPTLPAGFTHKARVGWIRTDATANKYPLGFTQRGRRVQYLISAGLNLTVAPVMASGIVGVVGSTLVAVGISSFLPVTALSIFGTAKVLNGASMSVGPNSLATASGSVRGASSGTDITVTPDFGFLLESGNIYCSSNGASNLISCVGWEDNI